MTKKQTKAVIADRLIDCVSSEPLENAAILIENGIIKAVGNKKIIPPHTDVLELENATLMPGLIDTHCHPMMSAKDDYQTEHLRHSSAYKTLRGLKTVKNQLSAGWTSIRVAGDADVAYGAIDLKKALAEGLFTGPRLCGAAHYISVTGGGGDITYLSDEQAIIPDGLIVDGEQAMSRVVRNEIKRGSDWIKLLATGAFMTAHDNPEDNHMSYNEIATAVTTAKRMGVPVMAHAHGSTGIKECIKAGVRSIEHGTFIDEEGIDLMVNNGTYLVPTLYLGDYYIERDIENSEQQKMIDLSKKHRKRYFKCIRAAIEAGVKVVIGGDFGAGDPRLVFGEFGCLVEAGLSPMEAIKAGTRVGAELLGWDKWLGTIEQGKAADIIAVQGNPLEDLLVMEKVCFVMKAGKLINQ